MIGAIVEIDILSDGMEAIDCPIQPISTAVIGGRINVMKFFGKGDYFEINISIFGDGVATKLRIDLEKAPFNLKFKGSYPSVFVLSSAVDPIPQLKLKDSELTFIFDAPLPAADYVLRGPSFDYKIRFLYEGQTPQNV
jgi:hypothetical protein